MILFIACIIILTYIYVGYPCLLFILTRIQRRDIRSGSYEPHVSILIAAHNEERYIKDTLENKLSLDYPHDKIQIIVISDGSHDKTDEIVRSFDNRNVILIRQEPRAGKTAALNLAVPRATGEILIFSDANSIYESDALRKLLRNFKDPRVGYVTGKMIYTNPDGTTVGNGCSAYMKYENLLRSLETRVGSIVGVDGGIDAVRRELYRPMKPDQLPDLILPFDVIEQGYRVVYEPEAHLREDTLKRSEDEFRMRTRVSLRALWALWDMRKLLNPVSYGLFSLQLLSHKVLRYLSIVFIGILYAINLVLINKSFYFKTFFFLQSIVFGMALTGHWLEKIGRPSSILYVPYYFFLVNIAAGKALLKFLKGDKLITWKPRKG